MRRRLIAGLALTGAFFSPLAAWAQTEVQFWHAFTGRLGELVKAQVEDFNASQSDYVIVDSHKGNYSETLNAGIAAFRAGEQPHILMVFEVGTATMMAAGGAVKPVYEVMAESGARLGPGRLYRRGQRLLHHHRWRNAVDAVQLVHAGAVGQSRCLCTPPGVDPDMDLSTWQQVGDGTGRSSRLAASTCPLVTAWQSWVHLENFSAYHDVPFASQDNGFAGLDTELMLNGEAQVAHLDGHGGMGQGRQIHLHRSPQRRWRQFPRGRMCALYRKHPLAMPGISSEAEFEFDVRPLPYWEGVGNAPQNTIIGGASLWVLSGHEAEEYKPASGSS